MDRLDRIYQLHTILQSHRHPVTMDQLLDDLECSRSTLMRYIEVLRNYYGAPLYNRRGAGYYYDRSVAFEMPGLWFNAGELEALLLLQKTLAGIGNGLLREQLGALRQRVNRSLGVVNK